MTASGYSLTLFSLPRKGLIIAFFIKQHINIFLLYLNIRNLKKHLTAHCFSALLALEKTELCECCMSVTLARSRQRDINQSVNIAINIVNIVSIACKWQFIPYDLYISYHNPLVFFDLLGGEN